MFIAESGTSNDKCSEIYPGKTAFSEIETTNIKNFVETLNPVPILGKYAHVTGTVAGDFCKTHFGTEHQDGGEVQRFLANYSALQFLTDLKSFPALPYFLYCGKAVVNSAQRLSFYIMLFVVGKGGVNKFGACPQWRGEAANFLKSRIVVLIYRKMRTELCAQLEHSHKETVVHLDLRAL
jgi:hypothetical protein